MAGMDDRPSSIKGVREDIQVSKQQIFDQIQGKNLTILSSFIINVARGIFPLCITIRQNKLP
jgi:hypothetical protein